MPGPVPPGVTMDDSALQEQFANMAMSSQQPPWKFQTPLKVSCPYTKPAIGFGI